MSLLFFYSCGTGQKPVLAYPIDGQEDITDQQLIVDTTLTVTGALPVYFDSTDYLLFPSGPVKISTKGRGNIYTDAANIGDVSFTLGYLNGLAFTGDLDNIMVQQLGTSNFEPLTNKTIKIRRFEFLSSIRKRVGLQLLVMEVTDQDTNRNGRLTDNDIASLYISDLEKQRFVKLTPELHELLDWKVLTINERLYFRTLEDSDKNGVFNKNDKIHHYFLNLKEGQFTPIEYNPLI